MKFSSVESLVADLALGRMIIIMDDEGRENEGDLVMAAQCVRPQDINFMLHHARGLICLPMSLEKAKTLELDLMVDPTKNKTRFATNFTVSIEAATGVSTGISAFDRAHTIRTAANIDAKASDLVQPGHIFPLIANAKGVLGRAGHTEASCDLVQMAGFSPVAVIVEILREDGAMARLPDLQLFAKKHDLKLGTIAALIAYQEKHMGAELCV
jgi:3,4-dihydroxy 2-butanone 4-phosphate synthase/GTP cyclohydrolase II